MSGETRHPDQAAAHDRFGYDFDGTRRWQIARGQSLTPAQRLSWLEETVEEMQKLVGLARKKGRRRDAKRS